MHKFSPIPVHRHLRRALGLLAAISLALGCGGGSPGGGGGGNTAPTISFVIVNASYGTMTLGQTANCAAQVIGTGAYSSAVTWTATNATITSAGVLTPTAVGTATCTATSTQDPTKSGLVATKALFLTLRRIRSLAPPTNPHALCLTAKS